MKVVDTRQALHLMKEATDLLGELLPLCLDKLNCDEDSLDTTARDVERFIRRLRDFREDHKNEA